MKFCHPNDAIVEDDEREMTKGDKMLYDCENLLFVFPLAGGWTDEQIMRALDFANEAYERGTRHGRSDKAYEVRKALGMTS